MDDADISLIICTRDRCCQLIGCLEAVRCIAFSGAWELIIVDNGSADQTRAAVQHYSSANHLQVKYLFEPKPGKSNALNTGIANAAGKIVAFTDDDCYPAPDFLSTTWRVFKDPSISYVVGRVMLHDPRDCPIAINESTTPEVYPARSFLTGGLGFFGGGCMAFHRNVLVDIGGFDPMFGPGSRFRYAEDLDLVGRASARGYEGRYCPEIVVRHHHRRKKSDTPAVWKACGIGTGAYHMKLLLTYREYWWFIKSVAVLVLHFRISRRMFLWEPIGAARYAYWWMTARGRTS
jgi:hypothetical protein